MKFRTTLLLGIVVLIAGLLAAALGGVAVILHQSARRELSQTLRSSREAFAVFHAHRQSLHRAECRVVAEEPRLKAVVATEDVSHETMIGVAFEMHKALGSSLFLITDGRGRLLADVLEPSAVGFDLKTNPVIGRALQDGDASGIWTDDTTVYEVHARRLSFGLTAVGVLVIGYKLDDAVAESFRRQTGTSVVFQKAEHPFAMSQFGEESSVDRDVVAKALAQIPPTGSSELTTELVIEGDRYLALTADYPGREAGDVRYVVLRSLDHALEAERRVEQVLYGIGGAALVMVLILSPLLSRRLSRPLDALVGFTQRVAAGKLDERLNPTGPIEVRTLGEAMNRMVIELGESRRQIVTKERLEKELEISAKIQTCILPRNMDVEGLDIAARMIPANEVGGDYYDILPVPGSTWIGIGDVAGHGLTCGLIMLMVQSIVSALARDNPQAPPKEVIRVLNRVLHENIRHRLGNNEHVTLTLLRYHRDGLITFAGAHEEIIVCRAATGHCELIPTPGPWVGAIDDVSDVTVDSCLQLQDGDIMVLYTDGITEARDPSGKMFGLEPLVQTIEAHRLAPVERIRDEVMDAVGRWTSQQEDDITLLVMRYSASDDKLT